MKKITLSLVAGIIFLETSANAQPLTEAIKNIDVSGTVGYRYNDYQTSENAGGTTNQYKVAVNASSKVNDSIKLNSRFIAEQRNISINTGSDADSSMALTLSEANFQFNVAKGLIVTLGKQGINSAWTVARDTIDNENTGTGFTATYTSDFVNITGAYYNQTNFNDSEISNWGYISKPLTGAEDFAFITANTTFANTTLDVGYSQLFEVFDSYTIGLNGSYVFDSFKLSPFARYTNLTLENGYTNIEGNEDNSLWQLGLSAKIGIYSAFAAYGQTDKEGGLVSLDGTAITNMDYAWRITASNEADAKYLYVSANAQVTDKVNLGVYYSTAQYGENSVAKLDLTNIFAQVKYKISKNLDTYIRYGTLEKEYNSNRTTADSGKDGNGTVGRVNIVYSF